MGIQDTKFRSFKSQKVSGVSATISNQGTREQEADYLKHSSKSIQKQSHRKGSVKENNLNVYQIDLNNQNANSNYQNNSLVDPSNDFAYPNN